MIYVTHDQTEALTFADTVVVMHDGRVVQSGTPEELFEQPGAHLRRLFHRLARHEHRCRPRCEGREATDRRPYHRARPQLRRLAAGRQDRDRRAAGIRRRRAAGAGPAVGQYRADRRSRPHPLRARSRRRRQFAARVPPGFSLAGRRRRAGVRSRACPRLCRQPSGRGEA